MIRAVLVGFGLLLAAGVASAGAPEPCQSPHDVAGLLADLTDTAARVPDGEPDRLNVKDAGGVITGLLAELAAACERITAKDETIRTYREREVPLLERIIATADTRATAMEAAWREALARKAPARSKVLACGPGGGVDRAITGDDQIDIRVGVYCVLGLWP